MTKRPASELAAGMEIKRDGCTRVVKSVSRAGRSSLIVTTDAGRFVYKADDMVCAGFRP